MVLRGLIRDSAVYGGADLLAKLIALATFPLIASHLSPAAFGLVELIVTAVGLLGLLVGCGLNNAVQRFYWDRDTAESERPQIVTSGLTVMLLLGALISVLGGVVTPMLLPILESTGVEVSWVALVAAFLIMSVGQWIQYILDVLRLHFSPWRFFSLTFLARILAALGGVFAVVWLGLGVDGYLGAQALTLLAVFLPALLMIRRDLLFRFDPAWTRRLVGFGYPFIFSGLAFWLFNSIDRWMLATMSSVEEAGIYAVAVRLSTAVLFASAAFGQAWSPYAMKIRNEQPERYRAFYVHVLLVLFSVMLVLGGALALFAGELLGLFFTPAYAAAAMPLILLSFGIVLQSTQQVTGIGISLQKKTMIFARLTWLMAFLNACGNWFLIPVMGASGAALSTLLSYLFLTGGYLYYTQRFHPLPINYGRLSALLVVAVCILTVALLFVSAEFEWPLAMGKLAFFGACLIALWFIVSPGELKP